MINLTQHNATIEQLSQGVVDLTGDNLATLKKLLTFTRMPTNSEIHDRAFNIARLADEAGAECAMIGGAPYLMPHLQKALQDRGITVLYAFSERVSVENIVDGVVVKTNEFKHAGFVEVFCYGNY